MPSVLWTTQATASPLPRARADLASFPASCSITRALQNPLLQPCRPLLSSRARRQRSQGYHRTNESVTLTLATTAYAGHWREHPAPSGLFSRRENLVRVS